jgi:hypothetical protein
MRENLGGQCEGSSLWLDKWLAICRGSSQTISNPKKRYLRDDNPIQPELNLLKHDPRYETETTRIKENEKKL